jgi:hypothetical protein
MTNQHQNNHELTGLDKVWHQLSVTWNDQTHAFAHIQQWDLLTWLVLGCAFVVGLYFIGAFMKMLLPNPDDRRSTFGGDYLPREFSAALIQMGIRYAPALGCCIGVWLLFDQVGTLAAGLAG